MAVAESKVAVVIKALGALEDDLDSLDSKMAEMKRQLTVKTQKETDSLYEKTRQMASAEAEAIISEARRKADSEAARISQEADSRLKDIQAGIDAGFEDAVGVVVSTVMKP